MLHTPKMVLLLLTVLWANPPLGQDVAKDIAQAGSKDTVEDKSPEQPISSRVLVTDADEQVLIQEAWFDAPREAVWKAYTTNDGWTAWAAPVAEVDLRVGGTIFTHYDPKAKIGSPGTNTLHIVNYVPLELLTLKAEVGKNWPEVLKKDADRLSNVILFERVTEKRTRVVSYGIGYSNTPELASMMKFFTKANEELLRGLKRYLESGTPRKFGS